MRSLGYQELLAISGLSDVQLKTLRRREQLGLSFGRVDLYLNVDYSALDALALELVRALAMKLPRSRAASIVRHEWRTWTPLIARAESDPSKPVYLYIIDSDGGTLVTGDGRFTSTPRSYVAIELQSIIADVRSAGARAGFDLEAPFLPPLGSTELAELLKPFDPGPAEKKRASQSRVSAKGYGAASPAFQAMLGAQRHL